MTSVRRPALLLLLVVTTSSQSTLNSVRGLTASAARRGHDVVVFFYSDGVRLLRPCVGENMEPLNIEKVRLLACRTSVRECGIESDGELVGGAEMSSLAALVELMEVCEKAVFL